MQADNGLALLEDEVSRGGDGEDRSPCRGLNATAIVTAVVTAAGVVRIPVFLHKFLSFFLA